MNGIYTLANDAVFDQLVALLNSIEANIGMDIPVAVIAYDNNIETIRREVDKRKQVFLLDDASLFAPWEAFSYDAWKCHPYAFELWGKKGIQGVNRIGMNRRYYAFDVSAPFENFIYFDADSLALNSATPVFERLQSSDFVVYDFQFKDPSHVFDVTAPKLHDVFPASRIQQEIFCAGFYAGRRGLFSGRQRSWLLEQLDRGESEVLYVPAPNQSLLNYMKMRLEIPTYNFSLELPPDKRTGCSVTSTHFEMHDNVLFDKGNRLIYLHYIGIASSVFRRLCRGENVDFPYRDVFLHYRYLHDTENRPVFTGNPIAHTQTADGLPRRILRKIGLA